EGDFLGEVVDVVGGGFAMGRDDVGATAEPAARGAEREVKVETEGRGMGAGCGRGVVVGDERLGGEAGDVVGEVVGRRIGGVAGRGLVVFAHQGEIEVVGGHGKNSMLPEKPLMGCAGVGGGWAVFARSEAGPTNARGGDAGTKKPVRLNRFSKVAARLGLEPRQSESESLVLPLH